MTEEWKNMEIKNIKISQLNPAEYNPREMDEEEMEALKNSIKEFGFVEPAVINKDYTIIGGHQRIEAARQLGWEEVPCFIVDLDKTKEKILNLALNRISGRWNEEKLIKVIKDLESKDAELFKSGFTKNEINQFLIQYEIEFPSENVDFGNREELSQIFERQERVEIPVNKPNVSVKKDKIAFYVRSLEEYDKIIENYKTNRKGELDIDKLLKSI